MRARLRSSMPEDLRRDSELAHPRYVRDGECWRWPAAEEAARALGLSTMRTSFGAGVARAGRRLVPGGWLTVAPEHRCASYDKKRDYPYPQSVERDIVRQLGAVYGPYTGTCFASTRETDIEHMVATLVELHAASAARKRRDRVARRCAMVRGAVRAIALAGERPTLHGAVVHAGLPPTVCGNAQVRLAWLAALRGLAVSPDTTRRICSGARSARRRTRRRTHT